jgi:hypothetical protein
MAGGLLGSALFGLLGKKKKKPDVIQPKPVTRDDAAEEAAREKELARRRGARADYEAGGSAGGPGGFGRFVPGS